MKLTFKTITKNVKFEIDNVEPETKVADVKARIEQEHGHDAKLQKLIYSGKILADDRTIASYEIKEKDFIVCMVSKPKAVPAAAPATPAPAPAVSLITPAPAAVATPQAPIHAPAAASAPAADAPTPAPVSAGFNDSNAFAAGEARTQAVTMLMEMGFERAQVDRAMRAAFNNPDRAAEYLMTGIPEHLLAEQQPQQAAATAGAAPGTPSPATATAPRTGSAAPAAAAAPVRTGNLFEQAAAAAQGGGARAGGAAGAAAGGGDMSVGDLEFLRRDPQFQQLRQMVQQNPQMLEPILQQLAAGNPAVANMIVSNPEAFLGLLADGEEGEDGGALPPGAMQVQVTPEENAAIERLQALGFEQQVVLQAYFACDKNEELAANYLFEHGHEDDEE
ncbi:XPC-binding domain-domain-containing protein [Protomyces lactucae-debilis]|uniref:UV excision repair protein RAD23 n=1 Tax=Protomyces lactucae-debilis TaxID=2754530 RepID=A0A1Y2F970_PROLT|nr:XPC-binding domain-containing protein [Protomyces lactucae-debilis]ORY79886.1 XPC-binding domain-domain-containing protein [Protomyces lactucae-debilis]